MRFLAFALFAIVVLLMDGAAAAADQAAAYSHDMSSYQALAEAALKAADAGKLPDALAKAKELEKAWDKGTKDLKKADAVLWKTIDDQMDVALDGCKSGDKAKATAELAKFLADLAKVPKG